MESWKLEFKVMAYFQTISVHDQTARVQFVREIYCTLSMGSN